MIPPLQQELLRKLTQVCELSPDVRFGQLLANLGFLVEDAGNQTLWDVEDDDFLEVIERHRTDLAARQQNVA